MLKKDRKLPLSWSTEVLGGLRSLPKVNWRMPYNTCNKRVLGQNKNLVSGAIFLSKIDRKVTFLLKNDRKQPRSWSFEVPRGLRSSPKVHWMMLYNFCIEGVLGQNKKWQIGKIFCQN